MLIILSHSIVNASRIWVAPSGSLFIGLPAAPATNVTIYLRHSDCSAPLSASDCSVGGTWYSEGTTRVYGSPLTPWTQLVADALPGAVQLDVEQCDGWEVHDELVVAPTGQRGTSAYADAEAFAITGMSVDPGVPAILPLA